MVKCSVSKKLKLTTGEILSRKAVNDKVRLLDKEQRAEIDRLRSEVKY